MRKIFLVSLLIGGVFIFKNISSNASAQNPSQAELCAADPLGSWKDDFRNGCRDTCFYARDPENTFCTQAISSGCNCEPDSCWDGKKCTPIDEAVIVYADVDFNHDKKVNLEDYEFMKERFFKTNEDALRADVTSDQRVDIRDYSRLITQWSE